MPTHTVNDILDLASEVTGKPVTADDSFFSLGGDSLTAVEFTLRVEEVLGVDVDVAALTTAPTLGAFATDVLAAARPGG